MSGFLSGKRAIVTGGSGTIGLAIAKAIASQGASVVLTGRSIEKLQKAKSSFETSQDKVSIYSCDVSSEDSVVNFFNAVDKEHGGVDLLVNNAGTMAPGATVDLAAKDFDRVMKVNVLGPFLCAREALKRMKTQGGGRIINMGSISAQSPRPDGAAYTTSKFALLGLSQSLSLDARQYNVGVGIVHPGNVRSELLSPEVIAEREKAEGFIEPEDVAQCVVAMASMPYSTNILELTVIPTRQPLVGRG